MNLFLYGAISSMSTVNAVGLTDRFGIADIDTIPRFVVATVAWAFVFWTPAYWMVK